MGLILGASLFSLVNSLACFAIELKGRICSRLRVSHASLRKREKSTFFFREGRDSEILDFSEEVGFGVLLKNEWRVSEGRSGTSCVS